jgi:hypothetical protein
MGAGWETVLFTLGRQLSSGTSELASSTPLCCNESQGRPPVEKELIMMNHNQLVAKR